MIVIDGGYGEGGGQILRTSLSLAALTGKDVRIENIRANRKPSGMRPQHFTAARAVADICGAEMLGAEVGSSTLTFKPHKVRPGKYDIDVSRVQASAGSVNLVLQSIIWPLAFAEKKSRVVIRGGTHVPFAPTFNYINDIFLPTVAEMGLICEYYLIRAGYYPHGGGEVRLEIRPIEHLRPVNLTIREEPLKVEVISAVSNLPRIIAERQMHTGLERLRASGIEPSAEIKDYPSQGKGTLFFISASTGKVKAGFQSLGELKKRAEKVADEACDEFQQYLDAGKALDKHLADQLIIPMALASGHSKFTTVETTNHLLTNIYVVQKFLDVHFHISAGPGEPGTVERVSA